MSLIDSLYILDGHGNPLVFKNYKQSNDRPLIKEFFSELNKHKERSESQYPIMTVKDTYFAYITLSDCIFVATFRNDVQVLLVINCMQAVIAILKTILGEEISSEGIKENNSKLAIVLDHLMDYGYPLITEKFALEQLFKKNKIIQKIETTLIAPLRNNKGGDSLEKFIDSMGDIRPENWAVNRPTVNDEILFDLVEYVDCIIDKTGNILSSDIYGEIKVNSLVPEPVEMNLYLQIPNQLGDFSIHECLYDSFDCFERDRMLNFKIPQGNFTLLSYNFKRPESIIPRVPLDIIPNIKVLGNDELKIDLKIQGSMVRGTFYRIYDINAKIFLPSEVKVKESSAKGLLKTNEKDSTILWKIGEFDKIQDVSASFLIGMNGKTLEELSKIVLCLKFQIDSYTFSGAKIERATFKDQDVKYTKKARSLSKSGFYEIRLN